MHKPIRNAQFLLCILNVIDNPSRDIYLAGALKSPLYNVWKTVGVLDGVAVYCADAFFTAKHDRNRA